TILRTANVALHVHWTGAGVHIEQCLIVTGGNAVHFEPQPKAKSKPRPRLNLHCTLDHNTFAARQAAVYVEDVPAWAVLEEPISVQSKANVFENPFVADEKTPARASMIVYQEFALPRGVLAWQGEGDVFDSRLFSYGTQAGQDGKTPANAAKQSFTTWERLW